MNKTRTIIIAIVGIIIIVLIGWAIIKSKQAAPVAQQTTSAQQANPQVQAQDVTVGTGTEATPGSVVSVLYEGRLPDGTVFDSSAAHGNQPLEFQLGTQGLIQGFQVGVNGMKVGGERIIAIPPALGYGTQDMKDATGKVIIPANSTIQFDVKLVNVQTLDQAKAALQAAQKTATSTPKTATSTKK